MLKFVQDRILARSKPDDFVMDTKGHRLHFQAGGPTLIISFDNAARASGRSLDGRRPWGEKFYLGEGHSLLGVMAATDDWFRCSELILALQKLSDDKFFNKFEKVVLTGASMGGFAAGAFAPLAPGCTVISMSPQWTRDPKRAPWEHRFPGGAKQDWTLPFGDAAKGIRSAAKAYVIFDSLNRLDLRHARRMQVVPQVELLPIPAGGHGVPPILLQMGLLKDVSRQAIAGDLSRSTFFRATRARKDTLRYYRMLAREAMFRQHNVMAKRVCEIGLEKFPKSDLLEMKSLALAAMGKPVMALLAMEEARARFHKPAAQANF